MKSFNYVITDEEITVEAEGPDEDAAAAGLEKFFEETL